MLRYEGGRWHRQNEGTQAVVSFKDDPRIKTGKLIRQRIKLEPIDSPTLFGIRPMLDTSSVSQASPPAFSTNDGTLFRSDVLSGEYDYEVVSDRTAAGPQPHEAPPSTEDNAFLSMPPGLKAKLKSDRRARRRRHRSRWNRGHHRPRRALEAFLRESGQFTYTLADGNLRPHDSTPLKTSWSTASPAIVNTSPARLPCLLRSVDIRSRIVNGFKGGDWNELTETLECPPETRP